MQRIGNSRATNAQSVPARAGDVAMSGVLSAARKTAHTIVMLVVVMACVTSCSTRTPAKAKFSGNSAADRALVVINKNSATSENVGQYYMQKRAIPPTHVVRIDVTDADEVPELEFRGRIARVIKNAIDALPVRIDFIVMTKGVPLRINDKNGYSVDGQVAGMNLPIPPMVGLDTAWLNRYHNPYFHATERFSSDKFGMYLVTRLDCAVVTDCLALVDRSLAAQPVKGPFFFDAAPYGTDAGYRATNRTLHLAAAHLTEVGANATLDTSADFKAPTEPVMGYVSWGSNDVRFNSATYHAVRFLPGALAETFVSTSARTFNATKGGQSRIVDLIAQGVTGVKGYVSEPFNFAMADPGVLFDRYLRGFTLAESFYAASRMVLWKDIVVGDPLCAPYAAQPPR